MIQIRFGILSRDPMASSRQIDLFQADQHSELFGEDTPTPEYRADPDSVRAELYKILAEARAAQKLPWQPKTVLLYRTIFGKCHEHFGN
jgi:hypothetical protein